MDKAARRSTGRRAVRTAGPLSGPVGIVRDLPVDFWHPSMGTHEEFTMQEEFMKESDSPEPPSWLQKAFVGWLLLMFVGVVTLGFIWFASKVIGNL